jgi:uncharacterized protein YcnI
MLAATAATGVAVLAAAGPAAAHVSISASETAAGAFTVLTVSVPHGCDGSATTKVAIQLPEEILSVTPTRNPFWNLTVEQEKLAEPVTDSHGNTTTERDSTVVYTAKTPLPDGQRDTFELSLQLPEEEGKTLVFPAIQTCERGETAWTEIAASGENTGELEHPAPSVTTTAALAEGGHGTAATATGDDDKVTGSAGGAAGAGADEDSSAAVATAGLGVGVLGLLVGGAALVLVHRRR